MIPFNILNYVMGITSIKVKDFALGCFGMIPGALVYVFIGTTVSDIKDACVGQNKDSTFAFVYFIIASGIALIGIAWISFIAKKKIDETLD